jgi:hypothetical protein
MCNHIQVYTSEVRTAHTATAGENVAQNLRQNTPLNPLSFSQSEPVQSNKSGNRQSKAQRPPNRSSTVPAHQAEHPERHSTWPETSGAAQRRERGDFGGGTRGRNVSPSSASLSRSMSACPLSRRRRGIIVRFRPLAVGEMPIAFSRVWPGGFGGVEDGREGK